MKSKLLLFLILAFAFFLRVYNLDKRGLFTDEKFTLLNANGFWVGAANQTDITQKKYFSPSDFWQPKGVNDYFESIAHSDFGTHIVYNAIVHVWMKVFGNSDYAVRFLSIIFNLLTIIAVYFIVLRVFQSNSKHCYRHCF